MSGWLPEQQPPKQFPNLLTGELIDRDDLVAVAGYVEQIRDHQRKVRLLAKDVTGILVEAARAQGTKTLHLGRYDVEVTGGLDYEWDVGRLEDLIDAGLPLERFNELVQIEQTTTVKANVAKQIAGSNPVYAEIIESAKTTTPKPERVKISGS